MAYRKGMSTGLIVAVTAIIILIVAVVVLGIFTGGMQRIGAVINSWLGGSNDPCDIECNIWQFACTEDKPYREFPGCTNTEKINEECKCKKV